MKNLTALVMAAVLVAGCGGGDDEPTASEEVREDAPPGAEPGETDEVAHQLASLDAGRQLPRDHESVSAYATILDELEALCSQDRFLLGDMAVTSQRMIEATADRKMPISVILESVNASIPAATENADCMDYFASWTATEQG